MSFNSRAELLSQVLMDELKALRLANGISKNEAASRAGLAVSFVSNLESGQRRPGVETLAKLAWVYGTSPGKILNKCEKKIEVG